MADLSFDVKGRSYRAAKMNAMTQAHILRRLAPALEGLPKMQAGENVESFKATVTADPLKTLTGIAAAIGKLSDADVEYVFDNTLALVEREVHGAGWQKVVAKGSTVSSGLMFDDIELPELLQIVARVLGGALSRFFGGLKAHESSEPPT